MSASKEEKTEGANEEPKAKPAGGGKRLLPMLVAVLVVLALQTALAVGVVRWVGIADQAPAKAKAKAHGEHAEEGSDEGGEEEEEEEEEAKPKKLECVEKPIEKTISVAGSGGQKYLKTSLCLEYDAAKYPGLPKAIEGQMMRVEYVVNRVLSTASEERIMDPAQQDTLMAEITGQVNKMLKHEKLKLNAVLVTEWLVQ